MIDKSAWTKKLGPLVGQIDRALKDVATQERKAEVATDAKNKALKDFDGILNPIGDLVATGLELIGEWALAEKVWPKERRSRAATKAKEGAAAGEAKKTDAPPVEAKKSEGAEAKEPPVDA